MSTSGGSKTWDLSPVLELANALSLGSTTEPDGLEPNGISQHGHATEAGHTGYEGKSTAKSTGLGDFSSIWQYLGVPASLPPASKHTAGDNKDSFGNKHDYASDGAIRYGLRSRERKTVTWRDDTSIGEIEPGSSPERDAVPSLQTETLTKSQRKKANRKARKAKEANNAVWMVSESEADTAYLQTPARKASQHVSSGESSRRASMLPTTPGEKQDSRPSVKQTGRQASQPELSTVHSEADTPGSSQANGLTHWPIAARTRSKVAAKNFLPSTVAAKAANSSSQPRSALNTSTSGNLMASGARLQGGLFPTDTLDAVRAVKAAQAQMTGSTPMRALPSRSPMIEPKIVRSGEDRHWALLLKLINEFPQDRKHLVSPMGMTSYNQDPTGLHLFVDASNIFIGFNDQLKRSRNIPLQVRVPAVDLSFDALALLMERRRPIAKRTLVGSTPHLPAFDKAKDVGYECSILEKVYKARELTERQVYFKERDEGRHKRSSRNADSDGGGYSSGGGYTSEAGAAKQYAPARMIEQGVDELLHMKMAQSLLDYDSPATMVVATGDAAQAEYSDGFKAMIERALKKGWTVELVSWSKNISSLYLRKSFQAKWGEKFKVIYLDDYAEELLDM